MLKLPDHSCAMAASTFMRAARRAGSSAATMPTTADPTTTAMRVPHGIASAFMPPAILGIGKLEKRVVVRTVDGSDAMLIRPMAYVSLTIDHRVLDGHQTNAWLSRFVEILETWPQP